MVHFSNLRRRVLTAALAAQTLTFCLGASGMVGGVVFQIEPGSAATTLKKFATQARVEILYDSKAVAALRTSKVKGELAPRDALRALLRGTDLTFREVNDHTFAVTAVATIRTAYDTGQPASVSSGDQQPQGSAPAQLLVAQVSQRQQAAVLAATDQQQSQTAERGTTLDEVVVTAEKRLERLQDVPVPVTSISADALLESNQLRLQDYYTAIPGLTVTPSGYGTPSLTIRGVTTGTGTLTNPTVGIVVDDVPYGSSTPLGGGAIAPDVDPSDLGSVEVLRGPQGTLYGASSIGGLLKYVTIDPSTAGFSGRVQADLNSVYNGDGPGYSVRGAVNIPISNTLAIRASGYDRRDAGYIDDIETGVRGVNREDTYGGRLSALWRPSDDLSLKLTAMLQNAKLSGSEDVNSGPGIGDLQQLNVPGVGFERKYEVYSAVFNAKLGVFDLTSVSGYSLNKLSDANDITPSFGALSQSQFGVSGTIVTEENKTSKFSQEIRLTGPVGHNVDWLLAGFYTHEDSPYDQRILAENATTAHIVGDWALFAWHNNFSELAAFTDLTVHFTDRFDVQLGGRVSHDDQTYTEVDYGPFVPLFEGNPSPFNYGDVTKTENSATYLLTPRFKVSPDFMVYGRLASGYRPGGPNGVALEYHLPQTYAPDRTYNYELGLKGDVVDHLLSIDASVYYIDWRNIQLTVVDPTTELIYYTNGSRAKSDGIELSAQLKPIAGLVIGAWVAWNDATLRQGFPSNSSAYGVAGDRLPYSSRFSGNVSVEDNFPVIGNWTGFVGGAFSYVGDRLGLFEGGPPDVSPRPYLPPYAKLDLRGGLRYDTWTISLFANNVVDRRGVLLNDSPPYAVLIQPRTIGLSVVKTF